MTTTIDDYWAARDLYDNGAREEREAREKLEEKYNIDTNELDTFLFLHRMNARNYDKLQQVEADYDQSVTGKLKPHD